MPNPLGRALRNRRAGHDRLVWARPELQAPETFALTSPAFAHGENIPARYRGHLRGNDLSPALDWTAPPSGTVELVLITQDPDVPFGAPAIHALAAGIDPALGGIPQHGLENPTSVAGLELGKAFGSRRGWGGPMPPASHGPHAYVFQLFAIDAPSGLRSGFTVDDAVTAITGHVIARARLDGMYEKL